jgi:hypothetical protein
MPSRDKETNLRRFSAGAFSGEFRRFRELEVLQDFLSGFLVPRSSQLLTDYSRS